MNRAASSGAKEGLTDGQRAALVRLLDDDDPAVYQTVRERILLCGLEAVHWLQPHAQGADPVIRQRVQEILGVLARRDADTRFLEFCLNHGEDLELEEGVWLLAQTRYPDINTAAYRALLDRYAAELGSRFSGQAAPREMLETACRYLFEELGYSGNSQDYYDPDNSYLNRVMDRRCGNPISLCTVFTLVGRRLRLPVSGVAMPGHFLCRYQSSTEEIFIDAFHGGRLLTRKDCVKYLAQSSYGFREGLLAPASPRRTLSRMCANLHQIYLHQKDREEAKRLQRYVVALSK